MRIVSSEIVYRPDDGMVITNTSHMRTIGFSGVPTDRLGCPMQAGWQHSPWTGEELY